jgi:hypothetical protein
MASDNTRSKTAIWLIGQPEPRLPERVLPITEQVLQTFYHHLATTSVSQSLKLTIDELLSIWARARIPTALHQNITCKLRSLVDEYSLLKKNKSRDSDTQRCREEGFKTKLKLLFDISNKDAETLVKLEEDKLFLEDQQGMRKMVMAGVDEQLTQHEERSAHRRLKEQERKEKEEQRKARENQSVSQIGDQRRNSSSSSGSDSDVDEDSSEEIEFEIPMYYKRQLMSLKSEADESDMTVAEAKRSKLLENTLSSPDVSSALDRINLSDRKFTILAAAIAKANREDLSTVALSRQTIRRKRSAHRSHVDSCVRGEFQRRDKPPLVVHWDGKLMRDTTNSSSAEGKANVDRVAVAVSGYEVNKILGIIKTSSGTGNAQATATSQLLTLWEVADDTVGMCFDTTASNTGAQKGACVLLEQQLGKQLLNFACRHHVHELIVSGVFSTLFGPSKSPNIPIFERFQTFWPNIDQHNFKPLEDAHLSLPILTQLRQGVISFLQSYLSSDSAYLPRDDYRELINLCLLILGASRETEYHFRLPGAVHQARWMAKVIYCFKIMLFREQFKLTAKELKNLTELCLFLSHVYVKAWISCPLACDAPLNDLLLYKHIKQYAEVNKAVADSALKKLDHHLWYVGPELVPLALFSNKVSVEEKRHIVKCMQQCGQDFSVRGIRLENCPDLQNKELHELITSASSRTLQLLHLDTSFIMTNDPETWNDSPVYIQNKRIVDSLKVVNDIAERSIALMSDFNSSITKNESEMQRLIQVVEDHRKRVPDSSKGTLAAYTMRE